MIIRDKHRLLWHNPPAAQCIIYNSVETKPSTDTLGKSQFLMRARAARYLRTHLSTTRFIQVFVQRHVPM